MRKQKPSLLQRVFKSKSLADEVSLEQEQSEESQVPTFTEIGGSPVPGLTLRHVFRGHTGEMRRIAWSPDGAYLASPSADQTIRIWDLLSGACVHTLEGHSDTVNNVAWYPDSKR